MKQKKLLDEPTIKKGENTGIYRQPDVYSVDVDNHSLDAAKKLVEQIAAGWKIAPTLSERLDKIEGFAKSVIKAGNKYQLWVLGDARDVINGVAIVRKFIKEAKCANAAQFAFVLGRDYERLQIRVSGAEKFAKRGHKAMESEKKARIEKSHKAAIRNNEIKEAVKQRLIEHPHDTVEYARHRVEDEHKDDNGKSLFGWSYENIRLVTRGMKKPFLKKIK